MNRFQGACLDRVFAVNDWYFSGYLPLTDRSGESAGMHYVGYLGAPFSAAERAAIHPLPEAFAAMLALTAPFLLRMAKGVFSPLERMIQTMTPVEHGDLAVRIGEFRLRSRDRTGRPTPRRPARLGPEPNRDRRLRDWADQLNQRGDARIVEPRGE